LLQSNKIKAMGKNIFDFLSLKKNGGVALNWGQRKQRVK
jgi:hypothetical protein